MPPDSTDLITMSAGAARTLTENIKEVGGELSAMLLEAHDGHAWAALGYRSWKAYVEAEFEFNRQHSYRLLNQARVNRTLEAAGSETRVNEREARDLSPTGDTSVIEQQVAERRQAPAVSLHDTHDKPRKGSGRGFATLALGGWLRQERENIERMQGAFDMTEGDIRLGLPPEDLRDLERTAKSAFEFWQATLMMLAEPVNAADEVLAAEREFVE